MNWIGKRFGFTVERGLFWAAAPGLMFYAWSRPGETVILWRIGPWGGHGRRAGRLR